MPVVGAFTIGLAVYFVLELPSTVPRTIGRRIRATLERERERERGEEGTFVGAHVGRVGRETTKVLRLASWDLKQRFENAKEESQREVKVAEELERKAMGAVERLRGFGMRSGEVRMELARAA